MEFLSSSLFWQVIAFILLLVMLILFKWQSIASRRRDHLDGVLQELLSRLDSSQLEDILKKIKEDVGEQIVQEHCDIKRLRGLAYRIHKHINKA